MKNFMVANLRENDKRYSKEQIEILLKAQIENSLDLGWKVEEIIILANFDFEFMGVKTEKFNLNNFCLTGSKMWGIKWLLEDKPIKIVWTHDLDCWQNVKFESPKFKDVGITTYSRPKLNGGSVFWKYSSKDIIDEVVKTLEEEKATREEPILNKILKSDKYKDRVTIIDNTYNVGCSGFVPRYERSEKPIKVCHFNPENRLAWETHVLDRNELGEENVSVGRRLERLVRKYYPNLAIKLKKGK